MPRALPSAEYQCDSLVTDVWFDIVPGLERNGREWISLCRTVAADLRYPTADSCFTPESTFVNVRPRDLLYRLIEESARGEQAALPTFHRRHLKSNTRKILYGLRYDVRGAI